MKAELPSRIPLPVSVVIPVYNGERFIAEALGTVAAQVNPPRETIVVDDGSTDRTAAIAASLGATVVSQANAGLPAARNAGSVAATQPWVAYLDVDDVWTADKLAQQWAALQLEPQAGFAFSDFATFDEDGILEPSRLGADAAFGALHTKPLGNDAFFCPGRELGFALLNANFIQPSSLIVRRDLARSIGGFDPTLGSCEDYDFVLRLSAVADAVIVSRPTLFYRLHPASMSAKWHKIMLWNNIIGERIQRRPELYPAGADVHFRRRRIHNINSAANNLLRNQRYEEAGSQALAGLRETPTLRGAMLALLACVLARQPGAGLHAALRRAQRAPRTRRRADAALLREAQDSLEFALLAARGTTPPCGDVSMPPVSRL
jgi:glycosyltransferase involved in cell wall biosynthesis